MENGNSGITQLLRTITAFEVVVLLLSGGGLFFLPAILSPIWPWQLTPFNMRFLGAIYIGSMVAVIAVAGWARWSPTRIVLPALVTFTVVVLIVSVIYRDRFLPTLSTWIWFAFYILILANVLYHLWLYRRLLPANPTPPPTPLRTYLLAQGVALALYGLALFIAPTAFSAFWPWPLDDFHGRMYSIEFLSPALASLMLWRAAAKEELLVLGWTQIVGGLFAVAGLFLVDAAEHRVDWSQPGTWLWIGIFAARSSTGSTSSTPTSRATTSSSRFRSRACSDTTMRSS